jgi:hypothetical protein
MFEVLLVDLKTKKPLHCCKGLILKVVPPEPILVLSNKINCILIIANIPINIVITAIYIKLTVLINCFKL